MASVHIRTRTIGTGAKRYDVRYREGGRESQIKNAGTFRTLDEAHTRRALVRSQIAAGAPVRLTNLPAPVAHRWIYFVRMGIDGPIKIGEANDVDRRVRNMQTGNPYPLALMAKMPWVQGEEERLHLSFRHVQLMGEWFRPVPELIAYIRGVAGEEFAA